MTKTAGMILIGLGLVGLMWGGFTYSTQEKIVDIGSIDITRNKTDSVPLPPLLGAASVLGGILLLMSGKKGLTVNG